MSSEQAPWVKVGVPVRRKASGFLHSRGEIVEVDGGLGVRCPTIQTVKRDDDIASSWEACALDPSNLKGEHATWLKEGTDVRFLGGGQPGTIVKVPGGLAVRYGGDRALLWSGSIAESWAPCEEAALPVAAQPVTPAGGPCAKPSPVDGVKTLDALLEQALCFHVGWPNSATTRHALRQLWERLDAEIGDDVRRLPDLAAKVREADAEAASTKVSNLSHTHGAPLPPSTMERILAWLDAIEATLKPLTHLALDAQGHVIVPPTEPTSTAKRYVQAHLARDEAAAASGWTDSYMATCSHCGAARWEGCTAVGNEPDYGEPVPRVNVRLWNAEGKAEFMSIAWPERTECVARGLFEVCAVLVPPVPGVLRPGLRPVARTWESLDDEERDYWHTLVKGYLDGTLVERTVGAIEWAALGAMVRVFGLQRKA